jgi:GAF domain-containing protein
VNQAELEPESGRETEDPGFIRLLHANAELERKVAELTRQLSDALDQQSATGEVLRVIACSPTDLRHVLDTIAESAARLSDAPYATFLQFDGEHLQVVGSHLANHPTLTSEQLLSEFRAAGLRGTPGTVGSPPGRAMLERRTIHTLDMAEAVKSDFPDARPYREIIGQRSQVATPLLRRGEPIGVLIVNRFEVRPFTDGQIKLLESFADQAVIAIENTRLIEELQQRLEEQTATSEILRAISSAPSDLQRVLDTITESAARLCESNDVLVARVAGDALRVAAAFGNELVTPAGQSLPLTRDWMIGRAVLDRRTIHVEDLAALLDTEYPYAREAQRLTGHRAALSVPLIHESIAIGAIQVRRREVRPFTERQVRLLETFADQAVIAISNAELFQQLKERNRELSDALAQQMATSEVLRVIASSPTDLHRVLDTIAQSAARLSDAKTARIQQLDGDQMPVIGTSDRDSDNQLVEVFGERALATPASIGTASGRAMIERRTIHTVDMAEAVKSEFPDSRAVQEIIGQRSQVVTPLLRQGQPIGVLSVHRYEVRPFTDEQIRLLESFADQAVIAIENSRLFTELQQRLDEQTAMAEALRVMSESPTDLPHVLDTIVGSAARLCESNDAVVARAVDGAWRVVATYGSEFATEVGETFPITRGWMIGRAILEQRTLHVEDLAALVDTEYPDAREGQRALGHRTVVTVPLLREGIALGAIQLRRREVRPFAEKHVLLLKTFADQVAIAISNAELFQELEDRNRELKDALERQTATANVLETISRAPGNLQRVLDAICESAGRLCGGLMTIVSRVEGESIRREAWWVSPEQSSSLVLRDASPLIGEVKPLDHAGLRWLAVRERRTQYLPDMQALSVDDPRVGSGEAYRAGVRAYAVVPLLRGTEAIGTLSVSASATAALDDQHLELLETFADQAVIAISNAELFLQLQDRNRELSEALAQQTATSEVLQTISRSAFELQAVLETLIENAVKLCGADGGGMGRFDGTAVRVDVIYGYSNEFRELALARRYIPDRRTSIGRVLLEQRPVHIPDVLADADYEFPEIQRAGGIRTILGVPMWRDGVLVGVFSVVKSRVEPFTERQIELVTTFADQAVIAIENTRLLEELQQRLEEQTATAEVLRVISQSPTDLQAVLDTIAASAARLCDANDVNMVRRFGDRIQVVTSRGELAEAIKTFITSLDETIGGSAGLVLDRGSTTGRAILDGEIVHIPSVDEEPSEELPISHMALRSLGLHTVLAAPLLREGQGIGAITIYRREPRAFSDRQIRLLETFASQAVIAISNAELFEQLQDRNRELSEALEQQTATSEVLQTISRSAFELRPVLETLLENAVKLSGGEAGTIGRFDGNAVQADVTFGQSDEYRRIVSAKPFLAGRGTTIGRVMLERGPVHIPDVLADAEYEFYDAQRAGGFRSNLGIPMLRDGALVGVFVVGKYRVEPFTERQIQLVSTFADQAAIAIENTRLFTELQQRLEEQTAMAEVLQIISQSPTDLQRVLDTVAERGRRLCQGSECGIYRLAGDTFRAVALSGPLFGTLWSPNRGAVMPIPLEGSVTGRAWRERRTVHVHDLAAALEAEYTGVQAHQRVIGHRTTLAVPLMRADEAIGVVVLARQEVRPFSDREIALLETFADQAVIAISNAELFQQLQDRTRELAASVEQLKAVFEVGQAVSSSLDLETVLTTIGAHAITLSSADGGGIFELDDSTGLLNLRTSHRQDPELVAVLRRTPLKVGEGAAGRAVATRKPVQIPDATVEGAYQSSIREVLIRSGFRALLAVPLLHENRVLGALVLNRNTPGAFAPEIVELVKTFASQSAIALQNARLFQELEEKNRALELAGRHKSQFLANMSHELRTPLNAILGYTELIQDGIYGDTPAKISEVLERVNQSGRHLLGLINAVLDLSKIEAGQLTLALADYSMADVVQLAVSSVESLAAEKNLTLRVEVAPDLPVGRGDERRISQVLLNLVGNAIKFTDVGEVRVSAAASDGQLVVSVKDTGPGIAPAEQERIFEEFQQVDASSTRAKGGTGLGLAIAQHIVELHGGRIRVDSTPGAGSTFTFSLPLRVKE